MVLKWICMLRYIVSSKTFGTNYLIPKNEITYKLPEYFQGNNLFYNISCTTENQNFYQLNQSENIVSDDPVDIIYNLETNSNSMQQMTTRWFYDNGLSFYYNETVLVCIYVDTDNYTIQIDWQYNLLDLINITSITGVQLITLPDNNRLAFVAAIDDQNLNSFIIVDFTDKHNIFAKECYLDDLKGLSGLKLYGNFRSQFVSVSGFIGNGANSSLYIINFKNLYSPTYQNITYSTKSLGSPDLIINPIIAATSVTLTDTILMVISDYRYFILYYLRGDLFEEFGSLNLYFYNNPELIYPYAYRGVFLNKVFVSTYNSVILINLESLSEDLAVNASSEFFGTIGFYENYQYLHMLHFNPLGKVLSMSVSYLNYPDYTLFRQDINYTFENIAFWSFFEGKNDLLLLLVDNDKAVLFKGNYQLPQVSFQVDDKEFSCTITAVDLITNQATNQIITIKPITQSNYIVSNLYLGQNYTSPLENTFIFNNLTSNFAIDTSIFSGFNTSCHLLSYNLTPMFYSSEVANPVVSRFKEIFYPKDSNIVYLDIFLIYITKFNITLYNILDESETVLDISGTLQVKKADISDENKALVILINNEEQYQIGIYIYNSSFSYLSFIEINSTSFIDAISKYIILAEGSNIQIYTYNESTSEYDFMMDYSTEETIISITTSPNQKIFVGSLLYIVSSSYMVSILSLDNLIGGDFKSKYISQLYIGHFKHILGGTQHSYFIKNDKVIVYDSLLRFKKTVFKIQLDNPVRLNDTLIGSYNNEFTIINGSEYYLSNAIYYTNNSIKGKIIGFDYFNSTTTLFAVQTDSSVVLYSANCPIYNSNCNKNLQLSISATNQSFEGYEYNGNLTINCSNENYYNNFTYTIKMIILGLNIVQKKINVYENDISYDVSSTFPLSNYVLGFDLQFELYIRNKLVKSSDKYSPFTVVNSIISSYSYNSLNNIESFALLQGNTSAVILEVNGFCQMINFLNSSDEKMKNFSFSIYDNYKSNCSLIETIAMNSERVLFAVLCNTYLNQTYFMPTLELISFNLYNSSLTYYTYIYTRYNYSSLRVITSSLSTFTILLIEKVDEITVNNHIEVYYGNWDNTNINLLYGNIINFYTLNLTKFLCLSADGYYISHNTLDIFIVDYYYGLRVLRYSNQVINFIYQFPINQRVKSIGYCYRRLYIGCQDTTIIVFNSRNNYYFYSHAIFPFNNLTSNYVAMPGYISFNNYYNPTFLAIPVQSGSSYIIRIINMIAEYRLSVLRDIKISSNITGMSYYFKAIFYNLSTLVVANPNEKVIHTFTITSPNFYFPSFTESEFKIVQERWGKSPYNYSLKVVSGNTSIIIFPHSVDRGVFSFSSSSDSTTVPAWKIALIIAGVLLALVLICFLVYKYFWKSRLLLPKAVPNEARMSQFFGPSINQIDHINLY